MYFCICSCINHVFWSKLLVRPLYFYMYDSNVYTYLPFLSHCVGGSKAFSRVYTAWEVIPNFLHHTCIYMYIHTYIEIALYYLRTFSILSTYLPQLERVGMQHQAGSDSYLTGAAFFKMKQVCSVCVCVCAHLSLNHRTEPA